MSTAKEIKELIDRMNKGEVSIDEGIDEMGDLFGEEILKEYKKEYKKSDSRPDYWKIAIKGLKRMLEEMERIEETEK